MGRGLAEVKKEDEVKQEVVLSGNLPIKHVNPSIFFVTYLIGARKLEHVMLALGSP